MLKKWKEKYPKSFKDYPHVDGFSDDEKRSLCDLLTRLEEKTLLVDDTASNLLSHTTRYNYKLPEIVNLLTCLDEHHCLTASTLQTILNSYDLPELQNLVVELGRLELISTQILSLVFSSPVPACCVHMISEAQAAGVDFDSTMNFLSNPDVLKGLDRALTIFSISGAAYSTESIAQLNILSTVLANPLCQTIFDARTRGFSDYALDVPELLTAGSANKIIASLGTLKDEESRVKAFFDFFADFRRAPSSQRYMVYTTEDEFHLWFGEIVDSVLSQYCQAMIDATTTADAYAQARSTIRKLQTEGADATVFNAIKYVIASQTEATDFYSERRYDALMAQIRDIVKLPQTGLNDYLTRLEESKGALQGAVAAMGVHGFLPAAGGAGASAFAPEAARP